MISLSHNLFFNVRYFYAIFHHKLGHTCGMTYSAIILSIYIFHFPIIILTNHNIYSLVKFYLQAAIVAVEMTKIVPLP